MKTKTPVSDSKLQIAQVALLTLQRAEETSGDAVVLGKNIPERQLEFAHAAGCERIIFMGAGGSERAIALRHRAESRGLKVLEVSGPHALAASVPADEQLLVLQPGLLPAAASTLKRLGGGRRILVLPSATGVEAGFERIDLARAWGGAMVIPGHLLSNLLHLPEDSEAAPALLRIGLQAGLAEVQLDEALLADGSWVMAGSGRDITLIEEKWLNRMLSGAPSGSLSQWLANAMIRGFSRALLSKSATGPVLICIALALAAGAGFAAYSGFAAGAFGLLALAALLLELAIQLSQLRAAPFGNSRKLPKLRLFIDLMLLTAGILSIDGRWFRQVFPPLVLLASFYAIPTNVTGWLAKVRDRSLLAAFVALCTLSVSAEIGLMGASLLFLGANLTRTLPFLHADTRG